MAMTDKYWRWLSVFIHGEGSDLAGAAGDPGTIVKDRTELPGRGIGEQIGFDERIGIGERIGGPLVGNVDDQHGADLFALVVEQCAAVHDLVDYRLQIFQMFRPR